MMKRCQHITKLQCELIQDKKFIDLKLDEAIAKHCHLKKKTKYELSSWHTQCNTFLLQYHQEFTSHIGWHTGCEFAAKSASANENPLYICGETGHHLQIQFTQLLSFQVYNNNERNIHQPCTSVAWSMGQAGCHYKDSNYKEAKWKEIVEILHLNKEDVIKKWKSDGYLCLR